MLREHRNLISKIHLFFDGLCIVAAWALAYLVMPRAGLALESFNVYFLPLSIFGVVTLGYLSVKQFRPDEHRVYSWKIFRELYYATLLGALFVAFVFYFFKLRPLSRLYLVFSEGLSFFALLGWNFLVFRFYHGIRERGLNYQHTLLVGNRYTLPPVIRTLQKNPALGQKIEAVLLVDDTPEKEEFSGLRVYQDAEKLSQILNENVIDNALFTMYRQNPTLIEKAMLACQERGISVWLKPDFVHGALISHVDYISDMPLFVFSLGPKYGFSLVAKRFLDVVCSILLLALVALPTLVIAFLIKTTPGPVFFLQKRVGLNGRRFVMAKFRTMYKDAEQRKAEYNLKNEMRGPVFKMKDDPRITPVGRFLRKYSLDELPQFWSVLVGDMSLVGPRPPLPSEVELYQGWQRRRLSMRPGITCIWQVTGRNKITDFNEWARLDLEYIDRWSPWLDLKILIKTVPAVFGGTGA